MYFLVDCVVFFNYIFPYSEEEAESEEEGEDPTLDSLSQAIAFQVGLQLKTKYSSVEIWFKTEMQHTDPTKKRNTRGLYEYLLFETESVNWKVDFMHLKHIIFKNCHLVFMSLQQACMEEEEQKRRQEDNALASTSSDSKKPRIKKSAYFSDEEELSD